MVTSKRRYIEAVLRKSYSLIIVAIIEIAILYLIGWLLASGLLDIKTTISVTLTELGISVLLFYLLGERRRSNEAEMVNLMEAVDKLSHLKAYSFSIFPRPFKYSYYFIENTTTRQCYKAPQFIEEMVELGVIVEKRCESEAEMRKLLAKKTINDREPLPFELMKNKPRRKNVVQPIS